MATKHYLASSKQTNQWIDSNERKVRQLQPVSKDLSTVQIQLQEVIVRIIFKICQFQNSFNYITYLFVSGGAFASACYG